MMRGDLGRELRELLGRLRIPKDAPLTRQDKALIRALQAGWLIAGVTSFWFIARLERKRRWNEGDVC